ncbi:ABC transporter permease [Brassicibacter mesophilus]|uniref:ABC transporter permease n=1 Tax=Brassicibacter mesophilus TaxID=745119 RepID=UPI003D1D5D96
MMNPVLKKELKTRMRSWKTPLMMSIYTTILAALMLLIFSEAFLGYNNYRGVRPSSLKEMFFIISILQLILIIFIVPATTSSSISGERERSTLDLLICTRLSSRSIILGKLMSSLAEIILLLLVSIPVLSIMFLFGGVSPGNILTIFAFYFVTSILLGSIGIFCSTFFKKTTASTIVSYLITLGLVGGTFFVILMLQVFYYMPKGLSITSNYPIILYANPFSGLAAILSEMMGEDILGGLSRGAKTSPLLPLYINLSFDLVVSFILLSLSSLKINPMTRLGNNTKKRKSKKVK